MRATRRGRQQAVADAWAATALNGRGTSTYNTLAAKYAARYGAALSQSALASPSHMDTDANRGTPWASGNFVTGLNVWRGIAFYQQVHAPSAATFTSDLLFDIDQDAMPLAADTVEVGGGAHYNGHPHKKTVGHWLAVYGFSGGGATAKFIDSSTPNFALANPTFTMASSTFATTYLENNGLAW